MKDVLNKALAANANTDAVAKVIDTVVNAPRQDVQSDTDEVIRLFAIDMITDAVCGKIDCIQAADAIISLINTANEQADAKVEHELGRNDRGAFENGFEPISVANTDANYVVNVDAAAKGKDKSDRVVLTRDANGRIIELRGVNNDIDELY